MLIRRAGDKSFLLVVFAAALLLTCCGGLACAQGLGFESAGSIKSLESVIGPIWPKGGLYNSFRSEVGTSYSMVSLLAAKLTGFENSADVDLRGAGFFDKSPSKYEIHADLRLWRLALKGAYSYFDTRSRHINFGGLDFTGMRLGAGFDFVQHQYWTFGAGADFYFIDPRYRGSFLTWVPPAPPVPGVASVDITGSRPATWGLYLRYMPPEIIGIPLHVEAVYNAPLLGSRLIYYGAALVFRPQLYRFDVSAKLGLERAHLKFSGPRDKVLFPFQALELDLEWSLIKLEVAAYF
jgi:hypothetical protein